MLKADGRDTRGAGNASAMITAHLQPVGDRTKVSVSTDLTVTGKVAQFGRGVMADVSAKLMTQFADNLEKLMESEPASSAKVDDANAAPAAGTEPSAASVGVRKIDSPEAKPVDLIATTGSPVLKRLAPVLGAVVGLSLLLRRFRRRRNK